MASQRPVQTSVGCAWIQDTEPPLADRGVGMSWLNTSSIPYLLETWDGANWVVQDYVTMSGQVGIAGYTLGGSTSGYALISVIQKLSFVTDSASSILNTLVAVHSQGLSGNGPHSVLAGYDIGGTTGLFGASKTIIQKLLYSTESASVIVSTSSIALPGRAQTCSSTAGYAMGGNSTWGVASAGSAVTDKLLSSTESTSVVGALTATTFNSVGHKSDVAGYALGKRQGNTPLAACDKMLFSAETWSAMTSTLYGQLDGAAVGNTTYGWIIGGTDVSSSTTQISKLTFSTDSIASIATSLSASRANLVPSNSRIAGLLLGGTDYSGSTWYNETRKFIFSTEIMQNLVTTLPVSLGHCTGVDNLG